MAGRIPAGSIHGIVTDPPYGVKEYEFDQIESVRTEMRDLAIPPSFDGSVRQPLPVYALNDRERNQLSRSFANGKARFSFGARRACFLACNSFLAQLVYGALVDGGSEFRGQIIRIVRTLRAVIDRKMPRRSSRRLLLPRAFELGGFFASLYRVA